MLKIPHTKSGVGLSKPRFLVCHARIGGLPK